METEWQRRKRGETTLPSHMIRKVKGTNKSQMDFDKDTWAACKLLAQGKTYRETAEILAKDNNYNVEPATLRRQIQELMVQWKRDNLDCVESIIVAEFLRLEELEKMIMDKFEKSAHLRPNEYAILMKRGMTVDEIDEMYAEEGRELAGDPRYLDTLLKIQQRKLNLIGVNSGNDVQQVTVTQYNFSNTDIADLARIADRLQDNKQQELIDEQ